MTKRYNYFTVYNYNVTGIIWGLFSVGLWCKEIKP